MEITIREPGTGDQIRLDAQPEECHDELGWRTFYPQKDSFLMARESGNWQVVEETDMNPELVDAVADALQQNEEYNGSGRT
jgi:hypothetical protein